MHTRESSAHKYVIDCAYPTQFLLRTPRRPVGGVIYLIQVKNT